jgi:hypothetical protein
MEFVKKDIGRRLLLVNPVETDLPKMLKQVNPNYLAAVFGKFDWSPSATQEKI